MSSDLFNKVTKEVIIYKSYVMYMYKWELALNNQQGFLRYKNTTNKPTNIQKCPHFVVWFHFFFFVGNVILTNVAFLLLGKA